MRDHPAVGRSRRSLRNPARAPLTRWKTPTATTPAPTTPTEPHPGRLGHESRGRALGLLAAVGRRALQHRHGRERECRVHHGLRGRLDPARPAPCEALGHLPQAQQDEAGQQRPTAVRCPPAVARKLGHRARLVGALAAPARARAGGSATRAPGAAGPMRRSPGVRRPRSTGWSPALRAIARAEVPITAGSPPTPSARPTSARGAATLAARAAVTGAGRRTREASRTKVAPSAPP